ncbi:MAG: RDD family protein [Aeromicrobium sp.]
MEIPSLVRRLGSLLIDWVIAALSAVAIAGVHYPPAPLDKDPSETFIIIGFFILEVGVLTGLLGRSIGKRLLGMKVENPDGQPIGVPRALLRTALLVLVLPAIVMTDDKRGIHDLAAGSRVVKTPRG